MEAEKAKSHYGSRFFTITSTPINLTPSAPLSPTASFPYTFLPFPELLCLPLWDGSCAHTAGQTASANISEREKVGACI